MKKPKSIFKEEDVLAAAKGANEEQRNLHYQAIQLEWEYACQELASEFLKALSCHKNSDIFWVGDEIGGILAFDDYFVSTNIMADYFKYTYTPDQFFDWYDNCYLDEDCKINMKNFIKLEKTPEM